MIYYQMEDLDKKFDEMSKLESNNWEAPEPEKKKPPVRKVLIRNKPVIAGRSKPVASGQPKPVSGVAAAKASSLRAIMEAKRRALAAEGVEGQQEGTTATVVISPALSKVQVTVTKEIGKIK